MISFVQEVDALPMKYFFLACFLLLLGASAITEHFQPEAMSSLPTLYWASDPNPARLEQIELFQSWMRVHHPDQQFNLKLDSANIDPTKRVLQAVSGNGDDLIDTYDGGEVRYFDAMGAFKDIGADARRSGFGLDKTYPAIASEICPANSAGVTRQVAFPCNVNTELFFVNRQTFAQFGMSPPPMRWSLEQFEQIGRKFVAAANSSAQSRWAFFCDTFPINPIRRSLGQGIFNETGTRCILDRPEAAPAELERIRVRPPQAPSDLLGPPCGVELHVEADDRPGELREVEDRQEPDLPSRDERAVARRHGPRRDPGRLRDLLQGGGRRVPERPQDPKVERRELPLRGDPRPLDEPADLGDALDVLQELRPAVPRRVVREEELEGEPRPQEVDRPDGAVQEREPLEDPRLLEPVAEAQLDGRPAEPEEGGVRPDVVAGQEPALSPILEAGGDLRAAAAEPLGDLAHVEARVDPGDRDLARPVHLSDDRDVERRDPAERPEHRRGEGPVQDDRSVPVPSPGATNREGPGARRAVPLPGRSGD